MRAVAEAQALFVIGSGHALANVALRALTLRQDLKADLVKKFSSETVQASFDPFSSRAPDWISMNEANCKKLRQAAQLADSPPILELIAPIHAFCHGQAWQELVQRRGEDFHRWRPQSHGVQGVVRKSPWQHDGTSRSLGIGEPIYREAQGLAEEVAELVDKGMSSLAKAMNGFYTAWPSASNALGGPSYQLTQDDGTAP